MCPKKDFNNYNCRETSLIIVTAEKKTSIIIVTAKVLNNEFTIIIFFVLDRVLANKLRIFSVWRVTAAQRTKKTSANHKRRHDDQRRMMSVVVVVSTTSFLSPDCKREATVFVILSNNRPMLL